MNQFEIISTIQSSGPPDSRILQDNIVNLGARRESVALFEYMLKRLYAFVLFSTFYLVVRDIHVNDWTVRFKKIT